MMQSLVHFVLYRLLEIINGFFFTEFIGTFVLMFGILGLGDAKMADGIMPIAVGLLILVIGVSLGGPTGYAINPD